MALLSFLYVTYEVPGKRKFSLTFILVNSHPLALLALLQRTVLIHWYCLLFL